ncbi:ABC transporter ATP-binding protein [Falsiroseomonas sp. CW058]|uniref:ABC transporter ATP-binding protein n=1 Tax=Falsiroseomonas sp. CW058 TaxID=3388664 RepID=UPI003D322414
MILLDRVSKHYPLRGGRQKLVLNEVSGVINRGDAIGILGRNGAGKSTLMRMLGGVEYPNSGRIERRMSVSWPLANGIGVQASMSGADNARFVARIYAQPVRQVLDFVETFAELGPYLNMPVKTYSSGMMGRLLFAMSLAVDFDCYLIDEATSAGDQRFVARARQALSDRLRSRTVVMVSHSAAHIRSFCRTAAVLNDGALTFFEDLDEAIATYEAL